MMLDVISLIQVILFSPQFLKVIFSETLVYCAGLFQHFTTAVEHPHLGERKKLTHHHQMLLLRFLFLHLFTYLLVDLLLLWP